MLWSIRAILGRITPPPELPDHPVALARVVVPLAGANYALWGMRSIRTRLSQQASGPGWQLTRMVGCQLNLGSRLDR
jgi:hypothetical protein